MAKRKKVAKYKNTSDYKRGIREGREAGWHGNVDLFKRSYDTGTRNYQRGYDEGFSQVVDRDLEEPDDDENEDLDD